MADPVSLTIGAIASLATVAEGYGQYQEGKFQKKQADANADILRQNAARKRLETAINEDTLRAQNRQTLAKNIAASIEQGMGNSATTVGVLGQDAANLEQNALNLRYEGLSAAEGMDIQADYYNVQGKAAKRAGKNAFTMSLLRAPLSFASGYTAAGGNVANLFGTFSGKKVPGAELYNLNGSQYVAYSKK